MDTVLGLPVPCPGVESETPGLGRTCPQKRALRFLAHGALELGQLGGEGRRGGWGLRALGLFLAVEM